MSENKVIVFGVDGLIPELVDKFSKEGVLPNISKMYQEGASTKLLPYISTWGDLNWVSFLSGQAPGKSWIGQREPSKNEGNLLKLMEENNKKAALVHFPESISEINTNHFNFAPFWSGTGHAPFELASSMVYSTHDNDLHSKKDDQFLGWPRQGTLAHHIKGDFSSIVKKNGVYYFNLTLNNGEEFAMAIEPQSENSVLLRYPRGECSINNEDWSRWLNIKTGGNNGYVRFKLLEYDLAQEKIVLLQSQMSSYETISNDPKLAESLFDECGPFISKWTIQVSPEKKYYKTGMEEAEYQGFWLADAALNLINKKDFHLFATVYRLNDETHHNCLGKTDETSPFYEPKQFEVYENVMREAYQILDEIIGKILREKNDDTILVLASDHGDVPNHYMCDIYRRLEACNLCELDNNGQVILEKSRAYLKDERGGLEIYVNLKGRETTGIVDPEQYYKVQTEIFKALTTWFHETPNGTENVAGITLKKQDAELIGYWGDRMGDVIFSYNNGFVWGMNKNGDVVAPVSTHGANHGPQLPTASTNYASNLGLGAFYGPMIKSGSNRNEEDFGLYKMDDAGTTLAAILGISNLSTLTGSVMRDIVNVK